jgi:hypothetical protein
MKSADGMSPGTRMKKECEARLRKLVPTDESVVAVGTAEELRSLGADIGSGSGWTLVVVTSERLLFAPWDSPNEPHEEIRLDDVIRWASGTQYNSEALVLTRPSKSRRQQVPARTIFRFSRPDAQVAKALHTALSARSVPHESLQFQERSREERMRNSYVELHPETE